MAQALASNAFKSRHSPHADLRVSSKGSGRVRVTYTVRALVALAVALVTFAVASPSTAQQEATFPAPAAQGCEKPAPTTAAGYADLWASLPVEQWGGGDVSISAPLPDGRRVWLYGDTFSSGRMVHSSAVVQDGGCLHVSRAGAQLLPDRAADVVYWIESVRVEGGDLLVSAEETRIGKGGPWDFAYTGWTATARVTVDAAGDLAFAGWVSRVKAPKADPGALIDFPGPSFGYSVRTHDVTLASGEGLVTVARNYDDGVLRGPQAYAPLWFEGHDDIEEGQ